MSDTLLRFSVTKLYTHRLAYRAGVTMAVSAPVTYGFLAGLSVAFSTGARHKLEHGAVVRPITALHVHIGPAQGASVSTQIATLRKLLIDSAKHGAFRRVAQVRDCGSWSRARIPTDRDYRFRVKSRLSCIPTARILSPP